MAKRVKSDTTPDLNYNRGAMELAYPNSGGDDRGPDRMDWDYGEGREDSRLGLASESYQHMMGTPQPSHLGSQSEVPSKDPMQ